MDHVGNYTLHVQRSAIGRYIGRSSGLVFIRILPETKLGDHGSSVCQVIAIFVWVANSRGTAIFYRCLTLVFFASGGRYGDAGG